MLCYSYREALKEAALAGGSLRAEAAAHLAACAGCREAFAQEQALVQRIDLSLSSLVAPEIPPSLVPKVRAEIAARPQSRAALRPSLTYLTYAAAAVTISVVVILFAGKNKVLPQAPSVAQSSSPAKEHQALPPKIEDARPSEHSSQRKFVLAGRTASIPRDARSGKPEVLISADDQLGLERYVAALRTTAARKAATIEEEASAEIKPLEIAELDVKRLSIEPLESDDSN